MTEPKPLHHVIIFFLFLCRSFVTCFHPKTSLIANHSSVPNPHRQQHVTYRYDARMMTCLCFVFLLPCILYFQQPSLTAVTFVVVTPGYSYFAETKDSCLRMIYSLTTTLLAADAFYIYTNKLIMPSSLDALTKLADKNHKLAWGGVLGLGSLFSVLTINKMFGTDPLGKTWDMFKIFFSQEKVYNNIFYFFL